MKATISSLEKSRDEARSTLRTNAAQYMRILDLANRLQAKGQQERKDWEREKAGLEERVRGLEEVVVCGSGSGGAEYQKVGRDKGGNEDEDVDRDEDGDGGGGGGGDVVGGTGQLHVIPLLRAEVARLRERNRVLEVAVERMREEGLAVQEAARSFVEAGRLM